MTDMNPKNEFFVVELFGLRLHKGVTWLINWVVGGAGAKSAMGVRNLNLQRSQVRKGGKMV